MEQAERIYFFLEAALFFREGVELFVDEELFDFALVVADLDLDRLLVLAAEPDFLPPPSCLLTVAQARRSASLVETPRFS